MEIRHHWFFVCFVFVSLSANSISAFPNFSPNVTSAIPNVTAAWNAFLNLVGCRAGEKADGLAKLKSYFQYFGYINSSSGANFTDEFDDALRAAIRTYQLNFNLNATGELDEGTLNQIVRPRCGVADIINGSSTMNSGRAQSSSLPLHTVAHYSFFPGMPRWPSGRRDLTYAFLPDNQLEDSVRAVFARAFQRWSDAIPMTFTETSEYSAADINIGFYRGDHGDGEPFDGVLGTLAHSFSPPSGRFHLDGDENWVADGDVTASRLASAVDLESVAVHEIGHLLGLGHSSVEDAIMYPTIRSGVRKVDLAQDDVQGVQLLYGSNPNYNGSTTSTTNQERDTGDGGTHVAGPQWALKILLPLAWAWLTM